MLETIGRYQIQEELGEGGSSTVFRAFDQDRKRTVALKLLHPHLLGEPGPAVLTFLRRAAEGASMLSHRNLTKVLDVGTDAEFHFVCTEFVDGLSTYEVLARHGVLSIPQVVRVAMDVLDALDEAHQQEVHHGDVKPENVMIDRTGRAILTDFGMFREASEEARMGRIQSAGAVSVPPEAILGRDLDHLSDLFGVGVLVYELLTGTAAFPVEEDEDPWEVARRRVEEPPPRLADELPHCPPELDETVRLALARDPGARYQSAEDMGRALVAVCDRLELAIPEALPLDGLAEAIRASVEETRVRLEERAEPVEAGSEAPPPEEESTALRRGAGWSSVTVPLALVAVVWGLLLFRVGYLSISSFPVGASVYELPAGVSGLTPTEVRERGRALGPTPITFRRGFVRPRTFAFLWPGEVQAPVLVEARVPARGHVQIDVGTAGGPAVRTTRVFPTLWQLLESVWEDLGGGADGEARGNLEPEADPVDEKGDQALLRHDLEEAVAAYRRVIATDPRASRRAADRLVEAALANKRSDPKWAIRALGEALSLDAEHGHGHAILGELLATEGREGALRSLAKAAQRLASGKPGGLPANPASQLAEVRARLGGQPRDPLLRRWEAHLEQRLGRAAEARRLYLELVRERGWAEAFR